MLTGVNATLLFFILVIVGACVKQAHSQGDPPSVTSDGTSLSSYTIGPKSCMNGENDCPMYDGYMKCGETDVLLNDSGPVYTAHAPLQTLANQCLESLSCLWLITGSPDMNIYVQIVEQRGQYVSKDTSEKDVVTIGRGHDPSDVTSNFAINDLYYARRLDDGRVYIIHGNLAWVTVSAHGIGNTDCVGFDFKFTQRKEPDFCEADTTICHNSSICLPPSAYCDANLDCHAFVDQYNCDMCGNTTIPPLVPGVPHHLKYASSWVEKDGEWKPPNMDCFWLVTAPNDSVIEINILATSKMGPALYWDSTAEGVNEDAAKALSSGSLVKTTYVDATGIWIYADLSQENDAPAMHVGTVYELQLTAYRKRECGVDEFQCLNQECLAGTRRCDGIPDCRLHEDEYGCEESWCADRYLCASKKKCIPSHWVCDGEGDCPSDDLSDELDCGRCGNPYIRLSPEHPLLLTQPIDITVDCLWMITTSTNRSRIRVDIVNLPINEIIRGDPFLKAKVTFGYGGLPYVGTTVARILSQSRAYPKVMTFDGPELWIILDIVNNVISTPGRLRLELRITEYDMQDCRENMFSCSSGILCIDKSKVCDGNVDCPESDDEFNCGTCGESEYRCRKSGECVDSSKMCDGDYACIDRSDDGNCEPCGNTIIDLSPRPQTLTSVGYPEPYQPNKHCIWFVHADPGYDILVVFLDFVSEEFFDHLYVGNGTHPEPLAKFSGPRAPARVSLYSEDIWLSFWSDYIYQYRGFNLSLELVEMVSCLEGEVACNGTALLVCIKEEVVCDGRGDCPDATDEEYCEDICGETLIDLSGKSEYQLYSTLYERGAYPDKATCVWHFRTDARREKIRLDIQSFHLEQNFDFLHLGVGNDSREGLVASLTGTTEIAGVWFESSEIWLKFETDSSVSEAGFHITLVAVDKAELTSCRSSCSHFEDTTLCLLPHAYCDGISDCMDSSDETNCVSLNCSLDLYVCLGKQQCLLWESVCDGRKDCHLYHDDEKNCDVHGCPKGCNCFIYEEGLNVKCSHGWSSATTAQLAKITDALALTGANMSTLEAGLFKRLGSLRTLYLRGNNITNIHMDAFSGLRNLTSLDISENNIFELAGGMFRDLPLLTFLGMHSVPMQYIRNNAFDGLTRLKQLVLMRGNGNSSGSSPYGEATLIEGGALGDLHSLQKLYVDDHRLCCNFRSLLPDDERCINTQLESPLFNCGRLMPNTVLQAFMWILGFSALIGNLVVIAWRIREDSGKGSKYVHSFLVLNLAMSDFLMGVYMVIIATVDVIKKEEYYLVATEWRNSALCKAGGVMSVLSSEASVFFITLISVDRYLCIVHPFSRVRLKEKSVWVSVASIWVVSLLASLVPTILVTKDSDVYGLSDVCIGLPLLTRPVDFRFDQADIGDALGNDTYLVPQPIGSRPSWSYSIVLFLGVNLICFLLVTVCYAAIFSKVKRSIRRVKRRHAPKEEEVKMAIKMAVIVGSDFLCWMPVIILGILSQTSVIQIQPDVYAWLVVFVLPINSSLNPYLYTIVTAISRRRQDQQASKKNSQKPKIAIFPALPLLDHKQDYNQWTAPSPSPTASPNSSMNLIKQN
ncbi:uncharacterized protein LOC119725373 [Patiria miniata]|uniref:G-protein coupled receptor GRL101 n=1 Tax=Patiria miniata TaxID=46514 RepID=A0A913ZNT1_PATMI|nr:uncharacterized protein LOC119725373 [Patiria miniata]